MHYTHKIGIMNKHYFFFLLLALTCNFSLTAQTIYHVKTAAEGGSDINDGSDWNNAFATVQKALQVAETTTAIDQIWVAAGTYYPDEINGTNTDDRNRSFIMKNNLAIYGGFAGTETQLSQRNMGANETILSGDIDQDNALNGNSYTVVRNSGTNNTAILDGFTISGANANGTGLDLRLQGAGMYNRNASPRILNCQFKNNTASFRGGGTLNENGQPTFINCIWTQNNTSGTGGAISGFGSTQHTFINCTIEGNSAPGGSGGLFNDQNSQATLTNCILWNNRVGGVIGTAAANIANNSNTNSFSATYSLLQGHHPTGAGNLDGTNATNNPQFVQQRDFDDASVVVDLRLKVCSPALNVGSNAANGEMTDLASNPRIFNSETIDLGAYELQSTAANISFNVPTIAQPSCPSGKGSITLNATTDGGTLEYSIDGGDTYQNSNEFLNLGAGTYNLQIRVQGTDCFIAYTQNQVTFNEICCLAADDVVYVKKDATGNNDGTSWADAFTELQPAINEVCGGAAIWVAAGTYQPTEIPFDQDDNDERLKTFHLRSDVQIYGGFMGMETMLAERNPATNGTILDGNGGYHTLIATALTRATVIDGFTIQGGSAGGGGITGTYAGASFTTFRGGGMLLNAASPTINNCIFKNNLANLGSALTTRFESSPLLTNCLLVNNAKSENSSTPSVVENQSSSTPQFVNCTIANNDNGIAHRNGTNVTYTNTIVFGNNDNLNFFGTGAATIKNSLVEGSGGSSNWSFSAATDLGGNIAVNPQFVDSENGDFTLANCSSAINAGDNTATDITIDLNQATRIFDNTIDMGAYELQATPIIISINFSAPTVVQPTCPTGLGSITINATSSEGTLVYSVDGGSTYQPSNEFTNLTHGTYNLSVRSVANNSCESSYTQNPIQLADACCTYSDGIIYVNETATGDEDGTSWVNAFTKLKDALAAECLGTQIWVAKGTYYPDEGSGVTDNNRSSRFSLLGNQTVIGGFAGNEPADYDLSLRDFTNNKTMLSGDIDQNDEDINNFTNANFPRSNNDGNTNRVVAIANKGDQPVVLDGFTIEGGKSDFGAGLFINNSRNVSIRNCHITRNEGDCGSGVAVRGASQANFTDCTFSYNASTSGIAEGGGLEVVAGSSAELDRCTFYGNKAKRAGAISVYTSGEVTITNSLLVNNYTTSFAGAVYISNSSVLALTNCTVSGNYTDGNIGGINTNGDLSLQNSIIAFNRGNNIQSNSIENNLFISTSGSLEQSYSLVEYSDATDLGNLDGTNPDNLPQFIAPIAANIFPMELGDYRSSFCSPLINVGNNAHNPTSIDLAGLTRIAEETIDLGAYEYQGNPISIITATATPATCITGTSIANSDGKITISNFTASDKYQYSTGTTFDANNAIPSTPATIPTNGIIVNTLANANQSYTVRITDSNGCTIDRVVNLTQTTCGNTSAEAGLNQLNLCGITAQLAAVAPTIGTGQWSATPAGGSFDDATKPNTQFQGTMGGNYTLTWTTLGASDQVQISFNGDADNDTVQDCIDLCPMGDDRINTDGVGMPDACDCDPTNPNDEIANIPGVTITKTDLDQGIYQSSLTLSSTARINPNKVVIFKAGQAITLKEGFHAEAGSNFLATIEYCNFPNNTLVANETAAFRNVLSQALAAQATKLSVSLDNSTSLKMPTPINTRQSEVGLIVGPNPFQQQTTAFIDLPKASQVNLTVFDAQGRLVKMIVHKANMPAGKHAVNIIDSKIKAGVYYVHLRTDRGSSVRKVIALK